MRIVFTGNCQTTVLGWMLKYMNPDINIHWVAPVREWCGEDWEFRYIPTSFLIKDEISGKKALSDADLIVYQHINKDKIFPWADVNLYNCKKISLTSIVFNGENHHGLEGMKQRETKNQVDIKVSTYIDHLIRNGDSKVLKKQCGLQHHHMNLYKLILKDICTRTKLVYDDAIIDWFEKIDLPFFVCSDYTHTRN